MSNKQTPIEKAIDLIDGFLTQLDDIAESKNKQSSVEWLVNFFESGVTYPEEWLQAKEQAKAMHKKQSFETFKAGQDSMEEGGKGFDQWYQETFGGNNDNP